MLTRQPTPPRTTNQPLCQAVILADVDLSAQTLYPLTHDLPKSLLPLANRPLLQYQLDLLQASGFAGGWGHRPFPLTRSIPSRDRESF